jgi:hypothetical protein
VAWPLKQVLDFVGRGPVRNVGHVIAVKSQKERAGDHGAKSIM